MTPKRILKFPGNQYRYVEDPYVYCVKESWEIVRDSFNSIEDLVHAVKAGRTFRQNHLNGNWKEPLHNPWIEEVFRFEKESDLLKKYPEYLI